MPNSLPRNVLRFVILHGGIPRPGFQGGCIIRVHQEKLSFVTSRWLRWGRRSWHLARAWAASSHAKARRLADGTGLSFFRSTVGAVRPQNSPQFRGLAHPADERVQVAVGERGRGD